MIFQYLKSYFMLFYYIVSKPGLSMSFKSYKIFLKYIIVPVLTYAKCTVIMTISNGET